MGRIVTQTWNVFAAELADTARSGYKARPYAPCVYCGKPTRALSRVCLDHDDLPALEQASAWPCRSDRVDDAPHRLADASSSAADHVLPGADGDPGTVALDLLEAV